MGNILFRLEGDIDRHVARDIVHNAERHNSQIQVRIGECNFAGGLSSGIGFVGLAGAVAAIIAAIIKLWELKEKEEERSDWSYERALRIIRDEMAAHGVTEFSVKSLKGFKHLLNRDGRPSFFQIRDEGNSIDYDLVLFPDGDVYVLRIR